MIAYRALMFTKYNPCLLNTSQNVATLCFGLNAYRTARL